MSYLETVNQKKQEKLQLTKEQQELAKHIIEMRRIQAATISASQGKTTVILTDQTDLGDKLKEAIGSISKVIESTDTTALNKDQLNQMKMLETELEGMAKAIDKSIKEKQNHTKEIINAINSLKFDPIISVEPTQVTVPTPQVTVTAPDVDLSPIRDTLREYFVPSETKTDLDDYRAQDIKELGDIQYVGFVNPEGAWYIIENHVRENKMRYVFGTKGYAKAFEKAASYEYQLLNEAINALTS